MTTTDIENYESTIEEVNECLSQDTIDYDRIKKLEIIIAQYENRIYN